MVDVGSKSKTKKTPEKEVKTPPQKTPKKREIKEKRQKLDKSDLLRLMKDRGKESIDSDHAAFVKYIFPANDLTPQENRNKNYTRRRVLTGLDLILTFCDIYPKTEVKRDG